MDIDALKAELIGDPLGRGYAGMTAEEAAARLNVKDRSENKPTMEAHEIIQAIDKAEFAALSVSDRQLVWNILHMGTINPFGIEEQLFVGAFGPTSTTITNLAMARKFSVSRGVELGLGLLRTGDIQRARM